MAQKRQRLREEGKKARLLPRSAKGRKAGTIAAAVNKAASNSIALPPLSQEFWKGFSEASKKACVPSLADDLALAAVLGGLLVVLWILA